MGFFFALCAIIWFSIATFSDTTIAYAWYIGASIWTFGAGMDFGRKFLS